MNGYINLSGDTTYFDKVEDTTITVRAYWPNGELILEG